MIGAEGGALLWTHLDAVKGQLEPTIISLAFVFLLVGYGTKVGLVPLHNWLPDAHAEGPTPISAVLSGLLLNVALYAVLRCKVLADGALGTRFAGDLMMGFGLLSVVVAAFFLSRQRDIKRMFAYSSIEHMGLITFAFGMGGPIANFAGLLHMTVHSLVKSAIFFAVGHAAQKAGTQVMDEIRGLIKVSPTVGWGLMIGSLAILGMPPFGVFASEFLILTTAMRELPVGDAVPAARARRGLRRGLRPRAADGVRRDARSSRCAIQPALLPVFVHLGACADARSVHPAVPRGLVRAGGDADRRLTAMLIPDHAARPASLPAPLPVGVAHASNARAMAGAARAVARCRRPARRAVGRGRRDRGERLRACTPRMPLADGLVCARAAARRDEPSYPDLSASFPAANRMQRAALDLLGVAAEGADDTRPWLRHGAWPADEFPAAPRLDARRPCAGAQDDYPFVERQGDGVHEIPVGPIHAGIIEPGHFRFSVVGEKVLRLEERLGYTHKGIEKRFEAAPLAEGASARRAASRATRRWPTPGPTRMALESRGAMRRRRRARSGCARCCWSASASPITSATSARSATTRRSRSAWRSSRGCKRGLAAHIAGASSATADDGLHRRRAAWPPIATAARRRMLPRSATRRARGAAAAHDLRRARRPAGPLHHHRARQARARGAARADRARRARQRPGAGTCACDQPCAPYDSSKCSMATHRQRRRRGARDVRFDEIVESLRLIRAICAGLPAGDTPRRVRLRAARRPAASAGSKAGAARCSSHSRRRRTARIRRCHRHDPSWQNWPLLEHAVIGNIVPDFPLINKSST